ncbi:hypothetical protein FIBSPDRAFT_945006 [Athelia psychrophila]|uniref:Ketoreductase (KR) domain-containing protein n=1 Tax=Athelia psychrophila TaxID=1759441 RepID=A0A166U9T6_9AGAM|nr:hypothetical protein FIBSPDRAFT_945006 [Fibularhizoctonia sp. CBS 109695]
MDGSLTPLMDDGSARGESGASLAADGFDVAVNDVSANQPALDTLVSEIRATGRKACALLADVAQEAQVRGMVEGVVRELGALDVVRGRVALLCGAQWRLEHS